jgi:hypothetical protein
MGCILHKKINEVWCKRRASANRPYPYADVAERERSMMLHPACLNGAALVVPPVDALVDAHIAAWRFMRHCEACGPDRPACFSACFSACLSPFFLRHVRPSVHPAE